MRSPCGRQCSILPVASLFELSWWEHADRKTPPPTVEVGRRVSGRVRDCRDLPAPRHGAVEVGRTARLALLAPCRRRDVPSVLVHASPPCTRWYRRGYGGQRGCIPGRRKVSRQPLEGGRGARRPWERARTREACGFGRFEPEGQRGGLPTTRPPHGETGRTRADSESPNLQEHPRSCIAASDGREGTPVGGLELARHARVP